MEQSLNKSPGNQSLRKPKSKSKSIGLPMSTDWRDVNDLYWSTPIKDEGFVSCLAFGNTPTLEAWGWKSKHTDDNRCSECKWFDPVYDNCYLFGAARVDDFACESFQQEE